MFGRTEAMKAPSSTHGNPLCTRTTGWCWTSTSNGNNPLGDACPGRCQDPPPPQWKWRRSVVRLGDLTMRSPDQKS